ncbi:MAG: SET domain-containing protein-lysine N-methyltransferase [Proteobacteria bacterium]|nr:SET domain-containing protein-lysine N-methyltransferase [Pseudomonadota bacterium]
MAAVAPVESDLVTSELIEVRRSGVHGLGVFAAKAIRKGTRIIEYVGERVSHDEADRRYEEKDANDSHTFLFIVDNKTVIDAGTDGNDARFFNHSCDPNCESTVEKRRVYIEAIRDIEPGAELTYDYQIYREAGDPENIDEVFACRCGFANCRGTMLWPQEEPKKKRKAKKKTVAKTKGGGQSKAKTGASARTGGAKSKGKSGAGAKGKGKAGAKSKGKGGGRANARGKFKGKSAAGRGAKKKGGRRG